MRYGRIKITEEIMAEFLFISKNHSLETWRITDLPDDTEIKGIEYDVASRCYFVTLQGSGAPFVKVSQGSLIPFITPLVLTTENPNK